MRTPLCLVPALTLAMGACGPPEATPTEDEQVAALRALEAETGTPWTARWHRDVRTPALLEGRAPGRGNHGASDRAARSFLGAHRSLYLMASADEDKRARARWPRSGA